ncbi:hypothetical protein [Candidatus Binatus soli]|jgi:hypothetical protein|uniref:hypothetical protein n=1 Tax=Candidatus Binatus soli TaxID=1953413 RepID=UPI003D1150F9
MNGTATPANLSGNPAMAVRFRIWRERILPRAAYRIEPRFWTPDGFQFAEGKADWQRRALKSFEPRVTGMAWTSSRLYLVIATNTAVYEHAAQLMHARALLRADPDYAEHRGKRVSMILLARKVEPAIADFARRQRVRVFVPAAVVGAEAATSPEPDSADSRANGH